MLEVGGGYPHGGGTKAMDNPGYGQAYAWAGECFANTEKIFKKEDLETARGKHKLWWKYT